MNHNQLPNKKYIDRETLFNGLSITNVGEIKIVDQQILQRFKGLMSEMIKKITQSISEGRGMIGVSLPIRIFEPRSTIERITDAWGYAVHFLSKLDSSPILSQEQQIHNIEQVMLFGLSGLSLSLSMLKPFNPLLGETYQGQFSDGGILSIEHISHHPPISYFFLDHPLYTFQGSYEYIASNSATFNQITLSYMGPNTLIVKGSGQRISYSMPDIKVSGMIWGDRLTKYKKYMVFDDVQNSIKAAISFGVQKQKNGKMSQKLTDQIYGKIYKYTNGKKKLQKEEEVLKMGDLVEQFKEVSGSYLQKIMIDEVERWNSKEDIPEMVQPLQNALPSDWRFREDLIWLLYSNMQNSEKWKLKLEEQQRKHKKLRLQANKAKKQNNKK